MNPLPEEGGAAVSAPETNGAPEQAPPEPIGAAAPWPPVAQRLRAAYTLHASAERTKTVSIVPGRYHGELAFRARPIAYEDWRKEAERAQRRGVDNAEAETAFAAKVICHSCETILVADEGELRPAAEVVEEFAGTGPVRFDARLCQLLGIEPVPSSEYAICRLVFSNKQAMQIVLRELLQFFAEETAGDEEEDDADRPI